MTDTTYTQCKLKRGGERQTSWVQTELAIEGQMIKLEETKLNAHGVQEKYWDEGWEVVSAGGPAFPYSYIAERGRDWKRTRVASDV